MSKMQVFTVQPPVTGSTSYVGKSGFYIVGCVEVATGLGLAISVHDNHPGNGGRDARGPRKSL
jgi:hypothetical protein